MMATEINHAKRQAKAQLSSITDMVKALRKADKGDDENAREDARRTIEEDALSVEVRSGWQSVGDEKLEPAEYSILLCTGGPACRIVGNLSDYHEPESARIEYQDWGTPWTDFRLTSQQEETVLTYARCFYFGE